MSKTTTEKATAGPEVLSSVLGGPRAKGAAPPGRLPLAGGHRVSQALGTALRAQGPSSGGLAFLVFTRGTSRGKVKGKHRLPLVGRGLRGDPEGPGRAQPLLPPPPGPAGGGVPEAGGSRTERRPAPAPAPGSPCLPPGARLRGPEEEGRGGATRPAQGGKKRGAAGGAPGPPPPPPDTDRAREKPPCGPGRQQQELERSLARASEPLPLPCSRSPFVAARCPGDGGTPRALSRVTRPPDREARGPGARRQRPLPQPGGAADGQCARPEVATPGRAAPPRPLREAVAHLISPPKHYEEEKRL
ncbi:uncharacterized protein LOC141496417 [Macrotis lagotis]|uniref:uncharacterized protein LOC141496417 n=1 Tax=Macrotis lagotis TaxID=92651 RepID=UPI003D68727B